MNNLRKMSSAKLASLIAEASEILAFRAGALNRSAPAVHGVAHRTELTAKPESVARPPEDDADFVLYIKNVVQTGGYVKVAERRRIAEIAREYPDWLRRQKLPADSGTRAWRNATQYQSARRAKER